MKAGLRVAAAIGLAAVALSQAAHAQAYCRGLKDVVAEATEGFESLKEEENFKDNFEPSLYLPDAYACWIDTDPGSVFSCRWQFDAPAEAGAKLDQLDTATGACLAGWARVDLGGKTSMDGAAIARGFRREGSGGNAGVFVEVFTEPPKERGSPAVTMNVSVR